jgi:ubiquinone/menaquinone biosynthesis C-methylase UbiE
MTSLLRRIYFTLFYLSSPPWDTGVSPPELQEYLRTHPPGRAIDLGCGTGTNVLTLAQAGWQVTGVDFIPRAIRIARRKVRRAGLQVDLHLADVTDLGGMDSPFDLALDIGCYHSLGSRKDRYLSELVRILAPGGHWLLYSFLNPEKLQDGNGLGETDLSAIQDSLTLLWRQDGLERGMRPSAWFLFQKSSS